MPRSTDRLPKLYKYYDNETLTVNELGISRDFKKSKSAMRLAQTGLIVHTFHIRCLRNCVKFQVNISQDLKNELE